MIGMVDTRQTSHTKQASAVGPMFNSIASRYDLLNHVLSGGIDFYWRNKAIQHLADIAPRRILDVATGTGDFAIAALRLRPDAVIGIDIAEGMLNQGRIKLAKRGLDSIIELKTGNAERLEFPDDWFDAATVAFGARNFEHLEIGLGEMRRVLRKGGKIVVLEFSHPRRFPIKQLYAFYFRRILPLIGRFVSGSRDAYTYLPETVARFPEGDGFLEVLMRVGFVNTRQQRLTFGIASVYTGEK